MEQDPLDRMNKDELIKLLRSWLSENCFSERNFHRLSESHVRTYAKALRWAWTQDPTTFPVDMTGGAPVPNPALPPIVPPVPSTDETHAPVPPPPNPIAPMTPPGSSVKDAKKRATIAGFKRFYDVEEDYVQIPKGKFVRYYTDNSDPHAISIVKARGKPRDWSKFKEKWLLVVGVIFTLLVVAFAAWLITDSFRDGQIKLNPLSPLGYCRGDLTWDEPCPEKTGTSTPIPASPTPLPTSTSVAQATVETTVQAEPTAEAVITNPTTEGSYVWGGDNKTVNGKPRRVSGKCATCAATFQPGEAVYGYTVMDINNKVVCDGGYCYSENVSFAGKVVDGVVNPWVGEVPPLEIRQKIP